MTAHLWWHRQILNLGFLFINNHTKIKGRIQRKPWFPFYKQPYKNKRKDPKETLVSFEIDPLFPTQTEGRILNILIE
jgi:hypothetical protein